MTIDILQTEAFSLILYSRDRYCLQAYGSSYIFYPKQLAHMDVR